MIASDRDTVTCENNRMEKRHIFHVNYTSKLVACLWFVLWIEVGSLNNGKGSPRYRFKTFKICYLLRFVILGRIAKVSGPQTMVRLSQLPMALIRESDIFRAVSVTKA